VVRVRSHGRREAGEVEGTAVGLRPEERYPGLDAADARGLLLHAQPLEERDPRGDERLAHQELRPPLVVEQRDVGATLREQDAEPRSGRTGADDGDAEGGAGHRRGIFPPGRARIARTTL